jgi:hypothetical protein
LDQYGLIFSALLRFTWQFLALSLTIVWISLALAQSTVDLGTSINYAVLGQSAITNVPDSYVVGNMGIFPANTASITGFALVRDPDNMSCKKPQSFPAHTVLMDDPASIFQTALLRSLAKSLEQTMPHQSLEL